MLLASGRIVVCGSFVDLFLNGFGKSAQRSVPAAVSSALAIRNSDLANDLIDFVDESVDLLAHAIVVGTNVGGFDVPEDGEKIAVVDGAYVETARHFVLGFLAAESSIDAHVFSIGVAQEFDKRTEFEDREILTHLFFIEIKKQTFNVGSRSNASSILYAFVRIDNCFEAKSRLLCFRKW